MLLNSGSSGAFAFNHDPDSLAGVHSYRQAAEYFPNPGGTFTGESLPGGITWARSYIRDDVLWMDIGRGDVVKLPATTRDAWWEGSDGRAVERARVPGADTPGDLTERRTGTA